MPGTQHHSAARLARAEIRPPHVRPAPRKFDLDLRLQWDSEDKIGWVWGDTWDRTTGELRSLPSVALCSADLEADVIDLLRALWAGPDDA